MENVSRIHDVKHPRSDSKIYEDVQCELEQFNDRIIFMSMYNDIVCREKNETQKNVFRIL